MVAMLGEAREPLECSGVSRADTAGDPRNHPDPSPSING
jgi:hypothetical protein